MGVPSGWMPVGSPALITGQAAFISDQAAFRMMGCDVLEGIRMPSRLENMLISLGLGWDAWKKCFWTISLGQKGGFEPLDA